jgi:hypothetical protein
MIRYRIIKIDSKGNSPRPFVFYQVVDDIELCHSYFEMEEKASTT